MATIRKYLAMNAITLASAMLARTPVERLALTSWLYHLVFRFGYPADEVTVDFRGAKLTVPTKDVTIVPALITGRYELPEIRLFERLAATSRTVIDVGGNIGLYACIAARHQPRGGRVVTFEPVPGNLRSLTVNLQQNEASAVVTVEQSAVGASDGDLCIYRAANSIGTHSASRKNISGVSDTISVPMVSLDSYLESAGIDMVDIVKIDIEGYDGYALRGASATLSRCKPALFVEFFPSALENCGFPAAELPSMIFRMYDDVIMLEKPQGAVRRCTEGDLQQFLRRGDGLDLIAVSRPDHRAIADRWLGEYAGTTKNRFTSVLSRQTWQGESRRVMPRTGAAT